MKTARYAVLVILSLTIIYIYPSCNNQNRIKTLDNGFVKETGVYYLNDYHAGEGIKLELAELKDGTLTFAMMKEKHGLLLQHDLFRAFSKYQKWALYLDEKGNLWFYNSDFGETCVWINKDSIYIEHDYCEENLPVPQKLLDYLGKTKEELCHSF